MMMLLLLLLLNRRQYSCVECGALVPAGDATQTAAIVARCGLFLHPPLLAA